MHRWLTLTGPHREPHSPKDADKRSFRLHRKSECTGKEKKQQKKIFHKTTENNCKFAMHRCFTLTEHDHRAASAPSLDQKRFRLHTKRLPTTTIDAYPDFCRVAATTWCGLAIITVQRPHEASVCVWWPDSAESPPRENATRPHVPCKKKSKMSWSVPANVRRQSA